MSLKRDWGYAKEYSEAMNLILENGSKEDFVIGTGKTTSIQEIVNFTFDLFDLDWKRYVEVNPNLLRKDDPEIIVSDLKNKYELGGKQKRYSM